MNAQVKRVVIVGGGSAGWLVAGILASRFKALEQGGIDVTLIESPDVKIIGVGEGTWPSMRTTLQEIGVSETEFMRECDVSFKQGSYFKNWHTGDDDYYHPFSPPGEFSHVNLVTPWQNSNRALSFADAVSPQIEICRQAKAPKQITTPEYAFILNYGYHLNAAKFGEFLKRHCVDNLQVRYISDHVVGINSSDDQSIKSLQTKKSGDLAADIFIDCTGFAAVLIGEHYKIGFNKVDKILFNDTALATQVVYADEDQPISSQTTSTAQSSGWVWDIALPQRRGCGYVYSSAHIDDDAAQKEFVEHLSQTVQESQLEDLSFRKIKINSGYRKTFWHKNCLAIGLSSGFVEPLEASALVMVEMSAKMLADEFPATKELIPIVADRFNKKFTRHWHQIIDFLKLHYCLSARKDSEYWIDNTHQSTYTDSMLESLALWQYRPPWHTDTPMIDELFPSASYQYVLCGMGYASDANQIARRKYTQQLNTAQQIFKDVQIKKQKMMSALPTNRDLIEKIKAHGFSKI